MKHRIVTFGRLMCLNIQLHQLSPELFIIGVLSTPQVFRVGEPDRDDVAGPGQRESSMADVPGHSAVGLLCLLKMYIWRAKDGGQTDREGE